MLGRFHGIMGVNMTSHLLINSLSNEENYNLFLQAYDMLVLPGGVKSLEKLRQEKQVLKFISDFAKTGKIIASTCHGAQLMISSKIVAGKEISGYYSIEDDINNAGAKYVNAPVVVSDNIVSSPHYDHMGIWMKTAIDMVKNGTRT